MNEERRQVLLDGGMSLAEADEQLMKIELLEREMKNGVAEFQFRKKDGTIRVAHGTLRVSSDEYQFKGGKPCVKNFAFWDCDKLAWRSFALASLI